MAELGHRSGIPIAAGENACTSFEFKRMFDAGAVQYAQPSVIKVAGITEMRKIAALAETAAVALMPHSPYFGPGFLSTAQFATAQVELFGQGEWWQWFAVLEDVRRDHLVRQQLARRVLAGRVAHLGGAAADEDYRLVAALLKVT